jgi:hypothetical protein
MVYGLGAMALRLEECGGLHGPEFDLKLGTSHKMLKLRNEFVC